jgi:hypothetical protein
LIDPVLKLKMLGMKPLKCFSVKLGILLLAQLKLLPGPVKYNLGELKLPEYFKKLPL